MLRNDIGQVGVGRNLLYSNIDDMVAEMFTTTTEKEEYRKQQDIDNRLQHYDKKHEMRKHPDGTFYHDEDWYEQDAKQKAELQDAEDYFNNEGAHRRDLIGEMGVLNNDEDMREQIKRGEFGHAAFIEAGNWNSQLQENLRTFKSDYGRAKYIKKNIPDITEGALQGILQRFHVGAFAVENLTDVTQTPYFGQDLFVGGESKDERLQQELDDEEQFGRDGNDEERGVDPGETGPSIDESSSLGRSISNAFRSGRSIGTGRRPVLPGLYT